MELGSRGDCLADRIARGGCPCETFELGNVLADVQRWQKWIGRFPQRLKRKQMLALVVSTKAAGNRSAGQNQVRLQTLYALAAEAAQASVPVLWEDLAREDFSEGRPLAPFSRQAIILSDWCRFGGRFRVRTRYYCAHIDFQDLGKIRTTCERRHGLCVATGKLHHTVGRQSEWRALTLKRPAALSACLASVILDAARAIIYNEGDTPDGVFSG